MLRVAASDACYVRATYVSFSVRKGVSSREQSEWVINVAIPY